MVMMTPQVAHALGDEYWTKWYPDADKATPKQVYEQLFNVETSDRQTERTSGMTGYGLPGVKTEGQSVTYDQPYQLYKQEITHTEYGMGTIVTNIMVADEKWGVIGKMAGWMAKTMNMLPDIKCAVVYNSCTATTYYSTANSEALAYDTHATHMAGTNDNVHAAAALSETALESGIDDWGAWVNHRGQLLNINPKYLVIPRQLVWKANKLMKSAQEPETANNAINPLQGLLQVIQWNRLTSSTRWFLQAKKDEHTLTFYKRSGFGAPDSMKDYDIHTRNLILNVIRRFGIGFPDWIGWSTNAGA